MPYDSREFLDRVADHDLPAIIAAVETEIYETEAESFGVHGAAAREQGSLHYTAFLKGVLNFLYHDKHPRGFSEEELALLREFAQRLVDAGKKDAKALEGLS